MNVVSILNDNCQQEISIGINSEYWKLVFVEISKGHFSAIWCKSDYVYNRNKMKWLWAEHQKFEI
jgi:hypothetical protein